MNSILKIIILCIALPLCGVCTRSTQIVNGNGGGTEITNGKVSGKVLNENGEPCIRGNVIVRRIDYTSATNATRASNDVAKLSGITDSGGYFMVDSLDTGAYCVEMTNGVSGAVLKQCVISTVQNTASTGESTIMPFATIKGTVLLTGYNVGWFVQVYGLERLVPVDTNGNFVIDDLPQGDFTLRIVNIDSSRTPKIISSISALSGVTTVTDNNKYYLSKLFYLNTTPGGANISATVMHFPLLVKLTKDNFDFELAQKAGRNISFKKSDNTPLAYEIEQWDSVNNQAEIWVNVDTILGNDSAQFIQMCFGDSSSSASVSQSNSAVVFDTANGFQGVWHMNQQSTTIVSDATVNHYDGKPFGTISGSSTQGAIGNAYVFDGKSSYIAIDQHDTITSKLAFSENGNYTVSAWVYLDTLYGSRTEVIVEKGSFTPSEYVLAANSQQQFNFTEYESSPKGWNDRVAPAQVSQWVYLVGVKNGTSQYLYVNGVCIDSIGSVITSNHVRGIAGAVAIGRNPYVTSPQNYFKGMIDEVRMSNVSRSADWIKLCYMNQGLKNSMILNK